MIYEHKCPKYKLDAWNLCYYKINCDIEDCENNCAVEYDKHCKEEFKKGKNK